MSHGAALKQNIKDETILLRFPEHDAVSKSCAFTGIYLKSYIAPPPSGLNFFNPFTSYCDLYKVKIYQLFIMISRLVGVLSIEQNFELILKHSKILAFPYIFGQGN